MLFFFFFKGKKILPNGNYEIQGQGRREHYICCYGDQFFQEVAFNQRSYRKITMKKIYKGD